MILSTLRDRVRFKLGNITTTEFSDANVVASLNDYQQKGIAKAITAGGQWEVNGDIASTNLVNGQTEYTLTTTVPLLTLKKIEVNFDGSTNGWQNVEIVDSINELEPYSNATYYGRTTQAEIFDNSVMFLTAPTANVTNGLKIWYSKEALDFANGEISTISINDDGANYVAGDVLTIGGAGTGATATVTTVDGSGQITALSLTTYGSGYAVATGVACTGGSGTGAKVNVVTIDAREPNLVEEVQTYLIHGACLDYCIQWDLTDKINRFEKLLEKDEAEIWRIYSNRLPAIRPQLQAKNRTLIYR